MDDGKGDSETPVATIDSRESWRAWLRENHAGSRGVWLTISKKGVKEQGLRYLEALEEALCFGWIDGKMRSLDGDRFILRFSPRRRGRVWSQGNRERALRLMGEGRMEEAGLASVEAAKRDGRWDSAYSSKAPPNVPEDLEAALLREPPVSEAFHRLSNSHRLAYVHRVQSAKRPETRKKRVLETIRRIREELAGAAT